MTTTIKELGTAHASYTEGYPIALYCTGPRGGFAGYADLSPETARALAQQLLDCAADAESGEQVRYWNVTMRHPDRPDDYNRGVRARNVEDARERAERMRVGVDADAEIIDVSQAGW